MHVIHLVDGAERFAGPETRPTSDSHAYDFPLAVLHRNEARVVKHLFILVASDVYVNVRNDTDAKSLVQRIEAPIWLRTHDLLRSHDTHRFTVRTKNIKPAVQMIAAVSRIETAAHFTHSCDNLMRTLLRIDRPDQRLLTESLLRQFWE